MTGLILKSRINFLCIRLPLLVCALLLSLMLRAVYAEDKAPQHVVRDLPYGEVLFDFYKQDYFAAITRLIAEKQQQRLLNHVDDSEILLGGMDLSYGMHEEARRIFLQVLDNSVKEATRNRAWYYLGKISYQRGYMQEALDSLNRISGDLPLQVQGDQQLLLGNVFMSAGRYQEAAAVLQDWRGPRPWSPYARYNHGVALIRSGRLEAGLDLLDDVGKLKAKDEGGLALKDKANMASGFTLLQNDQPGRARFFLERVRLSGPYSSNALLGTGWADVANEDYQNALIPWTELGKHAPEEVAVQESLLALPYAYGKLGAYAKAATLYEQAVGAYGAEAVRLQVSTQAISEGKLLKALLEEQTGHPELGWLWHLERIPDLPETRYLRVLMAGHEFQEAFKNFRDLVYLRRNLEFWANNMVAFDDMVATRERRYQQNLPLAEHGLQQINVSTQQERYSRLLARLDAIESSDDILALANTEESRMWAKLQSIEQRLEAMPVNEQAAELRDKHRLLKGYLLWQMNEEFVPRLWVQRKTLKQSAEGLAETQKRRAGLERAIEAAPAGFEGFHARIVALRERLRVLQPQLERAQQRQARYLEAIAIAELQRREHLLAAYVDQARVAMAGAYDKAAGAGLEGSTK